MPVLPKQADETECERGAVWSPAWNCRRQDDSGGLLAGDDVAYCCLPTGCPSYLTDPIYLNDLGDAVKVSRDGQFQQAPATLLHSSFSIRLLEEQSRISYLCSRSSRICDSQV